jgi:glycosyltransferase involved in cell wall biosynthesis
MVYEMGSPQTAPRVTVVLTTYKRANVLASTVEAILAQSYSDFELIITDDASPDETEAVCRPFVDADERVTYRRNDSNLGMPGNLIAAVAGGRGEYLAVVHDGDGYMPVLLERWVAALDACPEAGFVFNAYSGLDAEGRVKVTYREPLGPCQPGTVLLERIFFRRWQFDSPVWGTTMMRRSAYEGVGGLDPRFGPFADVDLWLRIAERHSVAYVAEAVISLPSRDELPRTFKFKPGEEERTVERMFLEARRRHFKDRHMRLGAELLRHWAFVACSRARRWILRTRRAVLERIDTKTAL